MADEARQARQEGRLTLEAAVKDLQWAADNAVEVGRDDVEKANTVLVKAHHKLVNLHADFEKKMVAEERELTEEETLQWIEEALQRRGRLAYGKASKALEAEEKKRIAEEEAAREERLERRNEARRKEEMGENLKKEKRDARIGFNMLGTKIQRNCKVFCDTITLEGDSE